MIDFDKRFLITKEEAEHWMGMLSVKNWHIRFEGADLGDEKRAEITYSLCNRIATFRLAKEDAENLSEKEIRLTAFHEICHLLLADMVNHLDRIVSEEISTDLEHSVVRTLENTLFELDYEKRGRDDET